ncbi:MAG: hypothetical protein DSZ29_04425 [Aquificaceae bacterium]|nr:MAG: hypothetical protein DSZ29_04425 [Aquificaceae bacterium]
MTFCGLDFGTSNSSVGIFKDSNIDMVTFDEGKKLLRSAIFLDDDEKEIILGRQAIARYMEGGEGRLMTSIKSVLGSSLMDEKTRIFNEMKPFSDILGYFIRHLKHRAESFAGYEIDSVVLGRPVRFHDTDDRIDAQAEQTLKDIAIKEGFKHIEFQYEPVAAALAYEKISTKEEIALVVDIGGGTSDFTIINIVPNNTGASTRILSTSGVHIGGTDFDRLLNYHNVMPYFGLHSTVNAVNGTAINVSNIYYNDVCTWHKINSLYSKQTVADIKSTFAFSNDKKLVSRFISLVEKQEGHRLLQDVESAKIELSSSEHMLLDLDFIEDNFKVDLTKDSFEQLISKDLNTIKEYLQSLVNDAQLKMNDINVVFFTGGSSQIHKIRQDVMSLFPQAKMVEGDSFGSVGFGLTLDAARKFS